MSALPAALAELRDYRGKLDTIIQAIESLMLPGSVEPVPPPVIEKPSKPKALKPAPKPVEKAAPKGGAPTCEKCGVELVYAGIGRKPRNCSAHGGKAEPVKPAVARKMAPCFNCNMVRREAPCEHCGAR